MHDDIQLDRQPLAIRAAKLLRDAIVTGDYQPGERLTEEGVAQRLGVSRNVVREAFNRLEMEGLIDNQYYRGKVVIQLEPKELADLLEIRIALECLAIDLAIKHLTQSEIEELQAIGKKFCDQTLGFKEFNEVDNGFHKFVARCSRNERLEKMILQVTGPFFTVPLHRRFEPAFSLTSEEYVLQRLQQEIQHSPEGHLPVIEKICLRQSAEAQTAMRNHLNGWSYWTALGDD